MSIVNDIINGACCAICGEYFIEEHGYPVICKDCWTKDSQYEKATNKKI